MKSLLRFLIKLITFVFGLLAAIFFGYKIFKKGRDNIEEGVKNNVSIKEKNSEELKEVKKVKNIELNLNDRQKQVYKLIKQKKKIEMTDLLLNIKGVTERTFRRDLLKLQQNNLIVKKGTTKSASYLLIENE